MLEEIQNDPTTSTRRIGARLNISHVTVWNILKENGLYPYHLTPVQDITLGDPPQRRLFCRNFLNRDQQEEGYMSRILWTDESIFTRDGIVNFHNSHVWADENPHATRVKSSQHRFKIMVWAGIKGNRIIGPEFFEETPNGDRYLAFLMERLPDLLQNVPEEEQENLIFMQDGAPPHFRRDVRTWLDQNYANRWMGRGGPIPWPPRSPDLTPMDFYVWGYLKEKVYAVRIDTMEQLRQRIQDAFLEITENLQNIDINEAITRRMYLCLAQNGGNFEQLL